MRIGERLVEKVVWVLFFYISFVPFYYMQEQSLSDRIPIFSLIKYLPFILSVLVLGLWSRRYWAAKRTLFSLPPFLFMVIFLGVSLLSLWESEYGKVGLAKWIYYNATGCILGLTIGQMERNVAWRLVSYIATISGLWVIYTLFSAWVGADLIWASVQQQYNPYYTRHRLCGPFGHTVATATYAMLLFPFAVWKAYIQKEVLGRVVWGGIALLYIPVVILTQTRASLIAMGLVVVCTAWWFCRNVDLGQMVKGRGLILVAAVLVGGAVLSQVATGEWVRAKTAEIGGRWSQILKPNSVTIMDGDKEYRYGSMIEYTERFRIAQYYTVLNILERHPVLGLGFGTFTLSFDKYKYTDNYMVREFPEHTTENMYLMSLAETGLAGLFSRLLLMGSFVVYAWKGYQREVEAKYRAGYYAYIAACSGLGLHMLTWDILNEPTLRITYWLLGGLVLAWGSKDVDEGAAKNVR